MRLVTYEAQGKLRPRILVQDSVVDADAAARDAGLWPDSRQDGYDGGLSPSRRVLGLDEERRRALEAAAGRLLSRGAGADGATVAAEDVVLGPPVPDPEKIICLGLNYWEHAAEASLEAPAAGAIAEGELMLGHALTARVREERVGQPAGGAIS